MIDRTIEMVSVFLRRVLILLVVILTGAVLYHLYLQRRNISDAIQQSNPPRIDGLEGFDGPAASEIKAMTVTESPGKLVSLRQTQLPLAQYVVKGAYHCAYTGGKYTSLDAVKYCLKRGCRWLDMSVYYLDGAARVAYGTDPTYVTVQTTQNLLLSEVLETVVSQGFASNAVPNSGDPLFVHLRICAKKSDHAVFGQIGAAIQTALGGRLYTGDAITGETPMTTLMGQVVVAVDTMVCPQYADAPSRGDPLNLSNFVHLETGGTTMPKYGPDTKAGMAMTPPIIDPDGVGTSNVTQLQMVDVGLSGTSPPAPFAVQNFVANYGVQVFPMKFYVPDSTLAAYEALFAGCSGGIVPMSAASRFFATTP